MQHFGMQSVNDSPVVNVYTGQANDIHAKKDYVINQVKSFIEIHVVTHVTELSQQAPTSNDLQCRFCGKRYVRPSALSKHEEEKHDFKASSDGIITNDAAKKGETKKDEHKAKKDDGVYNYTHVTLVLLLLRVNFNDAVKLGDGKRVLRLYKFFCLYYKVSNCPKYAFATLHLQAQVNCLLSPRLAYSLTWNRFVNHQGKLDTNFPMDMDVEHDNKAFKSDIHSFKGEITDKSIARVSHSTEPTDAIISSYDKCTRVRKPSGKHTVMTTDDDIMTLVEHLQEGEVYRKIPGRYHNAFPSMKHDILTELDNDDLKKWISKSLKKFSRKHFCAGPMGRVHLFLMS